MKIINTVLTLAAVSALTFAAGTNTNQNAEVRHIDSRDLNVGQSWNYIMTSYKDSCNTLKQYDIDFATPLKPFMDTVDTFVQPIAKLADDINIFDTEE